MHERLLIVGQGLAGTLLAWECERAGVPFEIADAGHEGAASRVGAGIINPVTGRRWVKTWRREEWYGSAERTYRELEGVLGTALFRPMRVRRRFCDEHERRYVALRIAEGRLSPYVSALEADGCWIEGAAQVDTAALIGAARARWLKSGRLRVRRVEVEEEKRPGRLVVLCGGSEALEPFGFIPWEKARGEILDVTTTGLDPNVIVNDGHWALPVSASRARVGASYLREPAGKAAERVEAGRAALEESARGLLPFPWQPAGWSGGWRIATPDRRPCIGRHPDDPSLGVFGALGSKGTLWAPALARQWIQHLVAGVPMDAEVDVSRYSRR